MKNLFILPTDKPSNVYINMQGFLSKDELKMRLKNKQIYITNSEEIKEGDWFAVELFKITGESKGLHIEKCIKLDDVWCNNFDVISTRHKNNCKKIILTTDQDLIKDGVQAIDDEFLEWFVKNPNCEEVEVEKDYSYGNLEHFDYKIIIPKEEPNTVFVTTEQAVRIFGNKKLNKMLKKHKQETLEEFIFKIPFDYNINPKEVIDMCMKEQQNIILTWRLGYFIDMINSLPDDTEKNRTLKSVFNNRDGELLLESYKLMKEHYEK